LRNKQTNEDEHHGLSSSSTLEKNNKNDDEPRGSSSSSTFDEKTKKLVLFLHFSTYMPQMH
jgi:hypothetical protein